MGKGVSRVGGAACKLTFSQHQYQISSNTRLFLVFFTSLFYVCYVHGLAALPKDSNFLYSCAVLVTLIAGNKYAQTGKRLKLDKPAVHDSVSKCDTYTFWLLWAEGVLVETLMPRLYFCTGEQKLMSSPKSERFTIQKKFCQVKLLNSRYIFRFTKADAWSVFEQSDLFGTFTLGI